MGTVMTLDQVKDLVRFARSEGARRFKYGDLEVEFGAPAPAAEEPKVEKKTPEQLRKEEDDLLFASAEA